MAGEATTSRRKLSLALEDVAKAKAAIQSLSEHFDDWMREEVAKLDAARVAVTQDNLSATSIGALYMCAHNLKGLAPTLNYPLAHELAASLCRLLDDDSRPLTDRLPLADDHIDAIRTVVFSRIHSAADKAGRQLVDQLGRDVRELLEEGRQPAKAT